MATKKINKDEPTQKQLLAFFNAFSNNAERAAAVEEAQKDKAAPIVLDLYEMVACKLAENGLPVYDNIIITKDGELLHESHFSDDEEEEFLSDEDEEEEYDGRALLKALKSHMKEYEVSIDEVADEIGIAKSTVKRWLAQDLRRSDVKTPGKMTCCMIAEYLDIEE